MRKVIFGGISLLCIIALSGCGSDSGGGGPNNNADLNALVLSDSTLSPTFSTSVTSYTSTVVYSAVTVTPTAADGGATITVQGNDVASGTVSASISLTVGSSNTITIVVTASDKTTQKTYTITVTKIEIGLGNDCTCTGNGCEAFEVPLPNGGTINDCDAVPSNVTGAVLLCLRTYTGTMAPNTYFTKGYCALGATDCTGDSVICNTAEFGDYASLTTCPAGSVLTSDERDFSTTIATIKLSANIKNKACLKSCSSDSDCRSNDGYICSTFSNKCANNTVKFCNDERNLPPHCTVPKF